jgi:hypothetical protein
VRRREARRFLFQLIDDDAPVAPLA